MTTCPECALIGEANCPEHGNGPSWTPEEIRESEETAMRAKMLFEKRMIQNSTAWRNEWMKRHLGH